MIKHSVGDRQMSLSSSDLGLATKSELVTLTDTRNEVRLVQLLCLLKG